MTEGSPTERIMWWRLQAAINIARVCRAYEGMACPEHMAHVKTLALTWASAIDD